MWQGQMLALAIGGLCICLIPAFVRLFDGSTVPVTVVALALALPIVVVELSRC